jgi:hypothetical protein
LQLDALRLSKWRKTSDSKAENVVDKPHPDTCAVIVDQERRKIIEIRKGVLVNQVTRDAEKIAKSFDALHGEDLKRISEQFALSYAIVVSGMIRAGQEDDDLRMACGELLSNSLNSLAAATYLLRGGYVLQPGPIIRSCLESLAVVLHLIQYQADLEAHRKHEFDSTRAIASAKRVFPPFGRMYGHLSKEFTHIGKLYKQVTPIREYTESSEPLELNMQFITTGVWMCYVTCELAFLGVVKKARYWKQLPTDEPEQVTYQYCPSDQEMEWLEGFLGIGNIQEV